MNTKILVVDDEERLRTAIATYLEAEGYTVMQAKEGREALALFGAHEIALVILDIMLPDMTGYDVCREIRRSSDVPILFLTALGDDDSHILGYKVGADDYITKPFRVSILALKANRILEKQHHAKDETGTLRFKNVVLRLGSRLCTVDGDSVQLTPREFDLLHEFMSHPGRVLTREYLLKAVWRSEYCGDIRLVDAMVKKLRKKLGPQADILQTVISVGYKLEDATS